MSHHPKTLATRFRVFRYCKQYMERHHRAPTTGEVSEALGLGEQLAGWHMAALRNAEGLDYPLREHSAANSFASEAGVDSRRDLTDRADVDTYFESNNYALHEGLKTLARNGLL